jgi:SAM-dependent methyltransferase
MSSLPRMYGELASWWPLLSAPEEYVEEMAIVHEVLEAHARRPVRTLLELGCGGGNDANQLKAHYDLTLSDLSPEMLEVSRALNPGCPHHQGDMRTLRLGRRFDAVFIHDALCYLLTPDDLAATAATAFEHCEPGGMVLLSPDGTSETFEPSTESGGNDAPDGRGARYLQWMWDPDPTDHQITVDYAYLLRSADGTVRAVEDRHTCGLFPSAAWYDALEAAGFEASSVVEPDDVDWTPRELFVGHRP